MRPFLAHRQADGHEHPRVPWLAQRSGATTRNVLELPPMTLCLGPAPSLRKAIVTNEPNFCRVCVSTRYCVYITYRNHPRAQNEPNLASKPVHSRGLSRG